jgi:tetratricopeptide (TPR) repeat protein
MGDVYLAVQEHPRRTVALKVIKSTTSSREALRRFEGESQILARLRHANIAQVYEAGTCGGEEGDAPFFAMEYIPNARSITDYARAKNLGVRDRLRIFADVCDAVHHGHQKGVIHRDLKPGNVLVDSAGHVKVIDFGVARATDSDLAITTLQTDVGELLGTLQYMSPEQVEADPQDIDIRSDVYALGVLLFELLTGQLPYDVTRVSILEAARIIKEQPPIRLSAIRTALRGDIETIVLQALAKDRNRRYQSAHDLKLDVLRYLRNEPIEVKRGSSWYVLRKAVTRHKVGVGMAALFVVFLAASAAALAVMYGSAERQRGEAVHQAAVAGAVLEFLNEDLLSSVQPGQVGHDATVREVIDVAAERIEGRFENEPLVEAEVRMTLGHTYFHLGEYGLAVPHAEAAVELRQTALGCANRTTLEAQNSLAVIVEHAGRPEAAESIYREMLETAAEALGPNDTLTSRVMHNLAVLLRRKGEPGDLEQARDLHEQALSARRAQGDTQAVITSLTHLALVEIDLDELETAEAHAREARESCLRELGPNHPKTLEVTHNWATTLVAAGRLEKAAPLLRDNLDTMRVVFPPDHPFVAASLQKLAELYLLQGELASAEEHLLEAYKILEPRGGTSQRRKNAVIEMLVELYEAWERPADADEWRRRIAR